MNPPRLPVTFFRHLCTSDCSFPTSFHPSPLMDRVSQTPGRFWQRCIPPAARQLERSPPSVTACRGTYALNIKLCSGEESQSAFTWQDRREAFGVWWLSSVLTLCKPEQLAKQGEAVMEKLLIFPRCKSTMKAFEYCIKACWHTDIGNLLYLHGQAPTNKCCRMQKNTRLSTFLHTCPQSNEISGLMFFGKLEDWENTRGEGIELVQQW